jgi:integrase
MNDLPLPNHFEQLFPALPNTLERVYRILKEIESFEDLERLILKGSGLAESTYKSYLLAVKDFYKFTAHKLPTQIRDSDIEAFYDEMAKRLDRNTAYLRIRGLKKYFERCEKVLHPFFESPFKSMSEKLNRKLNRKKRGNRTKKTLTPTEIKRLLNWLSEDTSEYGRGNYVIVYMLITSGLRSAEVAQLRWKNLELFEGKWKAYFIGKGSREAEQELYAPAVEVCVEYFTKIFRRPPKPEDALFYTVPRFKGDSRRPLTNYYTLWTSVKKIGEAAKEACVIKRELNFSPHLFRRAYATALYKNGMGIKAIQSKTRYALVETLMKHYIYDDEPATPYLNKMMAQL